MSLLNTNLAAVNDGSKLYLYYQNNAQIFEASSPDSGSTWQLDSQPIADHCDPGGSALTAYYIQHDGFFDDKSTIHVIYIDADHNLNERVKSLSDAKWTMIPFPDTLKQHSPNPDSKLCSGVCHDSAPGGHQWLFFTIEDQTGNYEVAELRRGSSSKEDWAFNKVLPDKPGQALLGAYMACNITDPYNYLIFQDYGGQIEEYTGTDEKWIDQKILTITTESKTPLAACSSDTEGKPHLFFVDANKPPQIQDYVDGSPLVPLVPFYPGSTLGTTRMDKKIFLFYREVKNPYQIVTYIYDGSKWIPGAAVGLGLQGTG
ncbi:hypothetical protein BJX99DRAFT_234196 [Aspergillus californicus]